MWEVFGWLMVVDGMVVGGSGGGAGGYGGWAARGWPNQ